MIWNSGGKPDIIMTGGFNKQVFSTFTGRATPTEDTKAKKIIAILHRLQYRHVRFRQCFRSFPGFIAGVYPLPWCPVGRPLGPNLGPRFTRYCPRSLAAAARCTAYG